MRGHRRPVRGPWKRALASVMAAQDEVHDLDGWTFPDGTEGNGAASSQVMWGHVWTTE